MPPHILIVDDDKHARRILQTLLSRDPQLAAQGLQITLAGDGEKGLAALEAQPVDLIISDLLMPRMDGFAFCRELRRRPATASVPLIVTSAIYKDAITIRKLRVEVGAEFFTKPFQLAELLAAVRRLLGLLTPATGTRAPSSPPREPRPEIGPGIPGEGTSGSLADRPLPLLLLDLYEARGTCSLQISRGLQRRRIHLLLGRVIGIESNSRRDALGMFLLQRGLLSDEQLTQALTALKQRQVRLGQIMLEHGWLTEPQLLSQMEAQLRHRIGSILRWSDGSISVTGPAPPYEHITLRGGTPALVFASLRDSARVDELAEAYGQLGTGLRATPRALRLREPFEQVFGPRALRILDQQGPLRDLLQGRGDRGDRGARDELLVRIEVLLRCGLALPEPVLSAAHAAAPLRTGQDEIELAPTDLVELADEPADAAEADQAAQQPADPLHRELLSAYLAADGRDLYDLLGVAREADGPAIQAAYQAACERLSPERFSGLDLGPDYCKISELRERYRRALSVLSAPVRRAAYDRELGAQTDLSPQLIDSELLFRRGEALAGAGQLREALPLLAEAAAPHEDQPDFHALLGWTRFLAARHAGLTAQAAAQQAEPALRQALLADPDHPGAHACAGHVAAALQHDAEAALHFEQVLRWEPARRDALAGLEVALDRLQQGSRLARCYRQLLQRLGAGAPRAQLIDLLQRLFAVVQREGRQEAARAGEAHRAGPEIAAAEAGQAQAPPVQDPSPVLGLWTAYLPDEPVPGEWLALLAAPAPAELSAEQRGAQAQDLRAAWLLQPDHGEIGRTLFHTLRQHHPDRAYLCAAVLCRRGQAGPEVLDYYQRHRPQFLVRAHAPAGMSLLGLVRHEADVHELEALLEQILLGGALSREPWIAQGPQAERIPPGAVPADFSRVAAYVGQLAQVALPPLYRAPPQEAGAPAGGGILLHGTAEPSGLALYPGPTPAQDGVLVGAEILECRDRVLLCFALARLAAALRPARKWALWLPPERLQALVQAAAGERLRSLDVDRFRLGLRRSGDRLGLLLCNDVTAAAQQLGAEAQRDPDGEADLLDFVLSPAFLAAREALGLSLAV